MSAQDIALRCVGRRKVIAAKRQEKGRRMLDAARAMYSDAQRAIMMAEALDRARSISDVLVDVDPYDERSGYEPIPTPGDADCQPTLSDVQLCDGRIPSFGDVAIPLTDCHRPDER